MQVLHPTGPAKLYFGSNWVQKTKHTFAILSMVIDFAHCVSKGSFGKIWVKITE